MLVSLVLLAHNEAAVIADEIRSFKDAVISRLPGSELVVAEDGSRDGTRDRIVDVSREVPLRLLGGTERLGYRRAVLNALASTTGEWICFADSGLKHDPADFWRLWNARDGHALVVGQRTNREDHWYRQVFTTGFNVVVRSLFDVPLQDSDSGLRLMHRSLASSIVASGLFFRNFSSTEVALRALAAGFRVKEVPVSYRQREGESRGMPLRGIPKSILGALSDLWRLRRELR
ncbi:MAG TPA: glycosyltransferase family 2 protein [Thermoanaerobaculia bacterium]|nr:glycosyltransferase family 2 protein [Thermoanaerobaculia bacterium]